jgi:recombinational DNA repair protein RecT
VWKAWPIEMAQKTAIKWACARGYVPIQSIEMATALAADAQTYDAAQPVEVERPQMQLASEVFAPAPEVEAEIIEDTAAIGGAE